MTLFLGILSVFCLALIALHLWERYQAILREDALRLERLKWDGERQRLIDANTDERKAWAEERRDLNNRIQVPEAAPYMEISSDDDEPQFLPFDDDAAFLKATEDARDA